MMLSSTLGEAVEDNNAEDEAGSEDWVTAEEIVPDDNSNMLDKLSLTADDTNFVLEISEVERATDVAFADSEDDAIWIETTVEDETRTVVTIDGVALAIVEDKTVVTLANTEVDSRDETLVRTKLLDSVTVDTMTEADDTKLELTMMLDMLLDTRAVVEARILSIDDSIDDETTEDCTDERLTVTVGTRLVIAVAVEDANETMLACEDRTDVEDAKELDWTIVEDSSANVLRLVVSDTWEDTDDTTDEIRLLTDSTVEDSTRELLSDIIDATTEDETNEEEIRGVEAGTDTLVSETMDETLEDSNTDEDAKDIIGRTLEDSTIDVDTKDVVETKLDDSKIDEDAKDVVRTLVDSIAEDETMEATDDSMAWLVDMLSLETIVVVAGTDEDSTIVLLRTNELDSRTEELETKTDELSTRDDVTEIELTVETMTDDTSETLETTLLLSTLVDETTDEELGTIVDETTDEDSKV